MRPALRSEQVLPLLKILFAILSMFSKGSVDVGGMKMHGPKRFNRQQPMSPPFETNPTYRCKIDADLGHFVPATLGFYR